MIDRKALAKRRKKGLRIRNGMDAGLDPEPKRVGMMGTTPRDCSCFMC